MVGSKDQSLDDDDDDETREIYRVVLTNNSADAPEEYKELESKLISSSKEISENTFGNVAYTEDYRSKQGSLNEPKGQPAIKVEDVCSPLASDDDAKRGQRWLQMMKARFEHNTTGSDASSMFSARTVSRQAVKQQFTLEHVAEILQRPHDQRH